MPRRTHARWTALTLCAVAAAAAGGAPAAQAIPRPEVQRTADRILDPAARGNISFEATANIASFQQDGVFTHKGWQYTAWYRASKRAVISRRHLPDGAWESIELDYDLYSDDSHNTIAMAVTPSDGRLHIAFPTHASQIRYTRSIAGLADDPEGAAWTSKSFEATQSTIPGAPDAPRAYTYPQFELVKGRMLLTWRDGGSNNGRQILLRYDDVKQGTWSYLGRYTDGAVGSYTSPYGTSRTRYAYLHGFTANAVTGDLESAFSWREQGSAWCAPNAVGNHDLGYMASSDGGMTWRNNAGAEIGRTGFAGATDPITIDDPHVVVPISIDRGLINQEAQAVDRSGRLHVMTSQLNDADLALLGGCARDFYGDRAEHARPFHHWRDSDGTWKSFELPTATNSAGRTKLFFDADDAAYVVLPDARIMVATERSNWTDWRIVFADPAVDNVAELIVDRQRLLHDGVLTVAYQETSATKDAPSAYRLADFAVAGRDQDRVKEKEPDAPRSTTPEAAPAPYAGSVVRFPRATASSAQAGQPASNAVDGSKATFWVSGGTQAGQGPSPAAPETLTVEYGEPADVRRVTVAPRVNFGPRAFTIQGRVDGAWRDLASATQANAEAEYLVPRTTVDAVRLVITSAYDTTPSPRNVQVAEVAVSATEP